MLELGGGSSVVRLPHSFTMAIAGCAGDDRRARGSRRAHECRGSGRRGGAGRRHDPGESRSRRCAGPRGDTLAHNRGLEPRARPRRGVMIADVTLFARRAGRPRGEVPRRGGLPAVLLVTSDGRAFPCKSSTAGSGKERLRAPNTDQGRGGRGAGALAAPVVAGLGVLAHATPTLEGRRRAVGDYGRERLVKGRRSINIGSSRRSTHGALTLPNGARRPTLH